MGCFPRISTETTSYPVTASRPLGNPNPYRYEIELCENIGHLWIVRVHYPDCTNFEGRKVLVMSADPAGREAIDPHFTEEGLIVARFQPTERGWMHAIHFAMGIGE